MVTFLLAVLELIEVFEDIFIITNDFINATRSDVCNLKLILGNIFACQKV